MADIGVSLSVAVNVLRIEPTGCSSTSCSKYEGWEKTGAWRFTSTIVMIRSPEKKVIIKKLITSILICIKINECIHVYYALKTAGTILIKKSSNLQFSPASDPVKFRFNALTVLEGTRK